MTDFSNSIAFQNKFDVFQGMMNNPKKAMSQLKNMMGGGGDMGKMMEQMGMGGMGGGGGGGMMGEIQKLSINISVLNI